MVALFREDGALRWRRVTGDFLLTRRQAIGEVLMQWAAGRRARIMTPNTFTSVP